MTDLPELKRADDIKPGIAAANSSTYIFCAIGVCVMTMVSVTFISIFNPTDKDTIERIFQFAVPLVLGLYGYGQHQANNAVDGRLTQLLITKGERDKLMGLLQGLQANPEINIGSSLLKNGK